MELAFLGGATTVTGSQFLLDTGEARVLVDCGMFQGSPNETVRNRLPFAYEPRDVDALLLTHAHLDHCGLIPHLVASGFHGSIYATAATVELAGLVLRASFAVGRTQDMVWELDRLLAADRIPNLPLYLDSPMASKATDIYRRHPEYFDEEMRALLARKDDPLDYPGATVTND